MWLSYIIPLYNCGPWVADCLDSLLVQGLPDDEYEVIVVNDGSTDGGEKMVERYCRERANFRLFNQENQGVSAARNRGMDEAKGEYLCFVDPDDWLAEGGMKILLDACCRNGDERPDVVGFCARMVAENADRKAEQPCERSAEIRKETLRERAQRQANSMYLVVWGHLFRRQLVMEKRLRFKPFITGQDSVFMLDMFVTCPEAVIVSTHWNLYRYRQRSSSVWHNHVPSHMMKTCNGSMDRIAYLRKTKERYGLYVNQIDAFIDFERIRLLKLIFRTRFSLSQIKELYGRAKAEGVFPLECSQTVYQRVASFFSRHMYAAYFMSIFYRTVYCPLKKWRDRNNPESDPFATLN